MSTLTSSSSQPANPLPPSPTNDTSPGGDGGSLDQADLAVWKRRYHALKESVDAQNKSKRKSGSVNLINIYDLKPYSLDNSEFTSNGTPTSQLGRGIRKVVFLCGEIKDLVSESDARRSYVEDPDNPDLSDEFEELNEDEVEELKREYVVLCLFSRLKR